MPPRHALLDHHRPLGYGDKPVRPARFYISATAALFVAVTISEYLKVFVGPTHAMLAIAFTCIWPVAFYCAATYTPSPWANNLILGALYVGITPTVYDNATDGWVGYPLIAITIGALAVALMSVVLLYSILLSLRLNRQREREETAAEREGTT
jgi:hypothetical protein